MEKQLDDICDALEEMIDAADDAWEAERMCLIRSRDRIRESRYEPAKEKFRNALDRYIDERIGLHYNKRMEIYDPISSGEIDL